MNYKESFFANFLSPSVRDNNDVPTCFPDRLSFSGPNYKNIYRLGRPQKDPHVFGVRMPRTH